MLVRTTEVDPAAGLAAELAVIDVTLVDQHGELRRAEKRAVVTADLARQQLERSFGPLERVTEMLEFLQPLNHLGCSVLSGGLTVLAVLRQYVRPAGQV